MGGGKSDVKIATRKKKKQSSAREYNYGATRSVFGAFAEMQPELNAISQRAACRRWRRCGAPQHGG